VIGQALSGTADLAPLMAVLKPADFYHPHHESLWAAVVSVYEQGLAVDTFTVAEALNRMSPNVKIDPTLLFDALATAGDPMWLATQITDASARRKIGQAAAKIASYVESETLSVTEVRERSRQALDDATVGAEGSKLIHISEALKEVIELAEGKVPPGLPTGWDDVDRFIGGLAPGRLVVFGARPGVGKSIAGTNLALQFAGRHNHGVLIASLEMTRHEVVQRMLAADASVNVSRLIEGAVTEPEWAKIGDRFNTLNDMPVHIHDDPVMTVATIRSHARELRNKGDLALIIVDYLQLMESTTRTSNRAEAVGQMSRGLKVLARETQTCVVAMSQLNRESLRNGDGRPRMSDLRESGSIEQDANVVILLHRPDGDLPEVEAIVAKNRHGNLGTATLLFEGHYARLRNNGWSPTASIA